MDDLMLCGCFGNPRRFAGDTEMPTYAYEAINQGGQELKEEIEAASSEDALAKIRNLGYFPTFIREKGGKAKAAVAGKKRSAGGFGRVGTKALTNSLASFPRCRTRVCPFFEV
jgi:hypothetical protein